MGMTEKDKKYYDTMLAKIVWHIITTIIFLVVVNCGYTYLTNKRVKRWEQKQIEHNDKKQARKNSKSLSRYYKNETTQITRQSSVTNSR